MEFTPLILTSIMSFIDDDKDVVKFSAINKHVYDFAKTHMKTQIASSRAKNAIANFLNKNKHKKNEARHCVIIKLKKNNIVTCYELMGFYNAKLSLLFTNVEEFLFPEEPFESIEVVFCNLYLRQKRDQFDNLMQNFIRFIPANKRVLLRKVIAETSEQF